MFSSLATAMALLLPSITVFSIFYTFVCILLIYISIWLIPSFLYGYKNYVPISSDTTQLGYHDDYFYYTRIKKIADGNFFNSDPIVKEFSQRPHIHCTYQLSYLFGALFSLKSKNIYHAFIGNTTLYPIIHTGLILWFAYIITNNIAASLLVIVLYSIIMENGSMRRFPNIMFTGIHIILVGIYALLYVNNSLTTFTSLFFIPIIGLSPVISLPNMLFTAIITTFTIVIDAEKALFYWPLFSISATLACYLFLRNSRNTKSCSELFKFAHFSSPKDSLSELKSYIKKYILILIITLPFYYFLNGAYRLSLAIILLSSFIATLAAYIQSKNLDIAARVIIRGSAELTLISGYSALLSIFILMFTAMENETLILLMNYCMLSASILLATRKAKREITSETITAYQHIRPTFRDLISWSQKLKPDEVILTLDFDINVNLPPYTSAYFYIPHAIQSTATEDEIWTRFEEACAFFRVSSVEYFQFISSLPSPGACGPSFSQHAKATRVLTYGQYFNRWHLACVLDEQTLAKRMKSYKHRLASSKQASGKLSGKASILIVSRHQSMGKEFCAMLCEKDLPTLFMNDDYAAFSINNAMQKALHS